MMRLLAMVALTATAVIGAMRPGTAMPPFAQAYAAKCTLCHTEVPGLNAYGRYVQRTGYAALDHAILKRSLPLWVGFNPSYDSQDPNTPHKLQTGNVAVHAIGNTGNWTYHVQQWLAQNGQAGGVDSAWVSYNNLFHRNAHLFFGKILTPAPSPFSQWFDLAGFAAPALTVGEHQYQLANNRWGSRFAYVHGSLDAEVAWLGAGGDLGGTSNFSNTTDKTVQWKVANANKDRPLEFGLFGSRGSFPLPEGRSDQYRSIAAYAQRDPSGGFPGMLVIYQSAFDADPGGGNPAAASTAATVELYKTFLHQNLLVSVRKEFTNDGLGNQVQSGNLDLEYHLARFVHIYAETYMAQNHKPGYRYMLWWTTPVSSTKY